jgi:hypothetical protein
MTEAAGEVIWVDVQGEVTTDPTKAVRGEILETLPDGTVQSTIFTLGDPGRS